MKKIAIYGKGGIGKSTIGANISAALSQLDQKVLQIGCDPKHDSTRLLLGGKRITTVLDYLKNTNPTDYKMSDILFTGFGGVGCIEAGGPEPGVGCAGRGILSTFELLNTLGINNYKYDVTLYDVLGDVVCGGFAVPIRGEYADEIYIVTSGEFMSLYAANNILRGIKNYDYGKKRVAGLLLNSRKVKGERERVEKFAQAVSLPIICVIPRSDGFALCEKAGKTFIEGWKDSPLSKMFMDLSAKIISAPLLYEAKPLTDEDLEKTVLGTQHKQELPHTEDNNDLWEGKRKENQEAMSSSNNENFFLSKSIISQEPLHGCAFNGAITMSVHVKDAIVIGHGPMSCNHITYQGITSAGRRGIYENRGLLPVPIAPNLISTNMDEKTMVFGGIELLKEKVLEAKRYSPKAIVVVSSCPSGIIGDDLTQVESLGVEDMPVIPIVADGNLSGDYLQGMILSYLTIGKTLIQKDVERVPDTVNIVFEKVVAKNTTQNYEIVEDLLGRLGIKINCRFLCETTVAKIQNFMTAPLNLLAHRDYTGRLLERFFQNDYGATFLEEAFPIGFYETQNWLEKIAVFFHKEDLVPEIIKENKKIYEQEIQKSREILKGKRLMVVTYNHQLDWLLEVAQDVEMEIVKVGVLNFSQDDLFVTRFANQFPIEEDYDQNQREKDIESLKPDIILSNYTSSALDRCVFADTIPYCPDVGFFSGLSIVKRWARLFQMDLREGWKKDEVLFQKYNAR